MANLAHLSANSLKKHSKRLSQPLPNLPIIQNGMGELDSGILQRWQWFQSTNPRLQQDLANPNSPNLYDHQPIGYGPNPSHHPIFSPLFYPTPRSYPPGFGPFGPKRTKRVEVKQPEMFPLVLPGHLESLFQFSMTFVCGALDHCKGCFYPNDVYVNSLLQENQQNSNEKDGESSGEGRGSVDKGQNSANFGQNGQNFGQNGQNFGQNGQNQLDLNPNSPHHIPHIQFTAPNSIPGYDIRQLPVLMEPNPAISNALGALDNGVWDVHADVVDIDTIVFQQKEVYLTDWYQNNHFKQPVQTSAGAGWKEGLGERGSEVNKNDVSGLSGNYPAWVDHQDVTNDDIATSDELLYSYELAGSNDEGYEVGATNFVSNNQLNPSIIFPTTTQQSIPFTATNNQIPAQGLPSQPIPPSLTPSHSVPNLNNQGHVQGGGQNGQNGSGEGIAQFDQFENNKFENTKFEINKPPSTLPHQDPQLPSQHQQTTLNNGDGLMTQEFATLINNAPNRAKIGRHGQYSTPTLSRSASANSTRSSQSGKSARLASDMGGGIVIGAPLVVEMSQNGSNLGQNGQINTTPTSISSQQQNQNSDPDQLINPTPGSFDVVTELVEQQQQNGQNGQNITQNGQFPPLQQPQQPQSQLQTQSQLHHLQRKRAQSSTTLLTEQFLTLHNSIKNTSKQGGIGLNAMSGGDGGHFGTTNGISSHFGGAATTTTTTTSPTSQLSGNFPSTLSIHHELDPMTIYYQGSSGEGRGVGASGIQNQDQLNQNEQNVQNQHLFSQNQLQNQQNQGPMGQNQQNQGENQQNRHNQGQVGVESHFQITSVRNDCDDLSGLIPYDDEDEDQEVPPPPASALQPQNRLRESSLSSSHSFGQYQQSASLSSSQQQQQQQQQHPPSPQYSPIPPTTPPSPQQTSRSPQSLSGGGNSGGSGIGGLGGQQPVPLAISRGARSMSMSSHSSLQSSHSSFTLSHSSHNSQLFEQFPTLNGSGSGGEVNDDDDDDDDDDNEDNNPLRQGVGLAAVVGMSPSPSKINTRLSIDGQNIGQNGQNIGQNGQNGQNINLETTTTTTTTPTTTITVTPIIYGDYGDIPLDLTQPTSPLSDYYYDDDVLSTHSSSGGSSILQDVLKPPALSFGSGGVDIDSEIVFMPQNSSNPTPPEHFIDNINVTLQDYEVGVEGGEQYQQQLEQHTQQQQQQQQQQPSGLVDQGLLNIQAFIQRQNSQGSAPHGDDDEQDLGGGNDDDDGQSNSNSNNDQPQPRSRRHSLNQ